LPEFAYPRSRDAPGRTRLAAAFTANTELG